MLKWLGIIALTFYIIPVQTHAQTNKAQLTPKSEKPTLQAAPVIPKHSDSPNLQPKSDKHVGADVWIVQTPAKDRYDKATFWVSAILVLIALGGVIYARKTLNAIEGQLAEIKAAGLQTDEMIANAGKQADAAINAARPFVMIEATRNGDFLYFRAVNYGKSPAKITFYDPVTKFEAIPIGEELPDKPSYGIHYDNDHAEVLNVQWLAPMKDMDVGSFNIDAYRDGAPEIYKDLNEGRRRLYVYSAVKYRGILEDKVYRSTFCYFAIQGGLRMGGPYGYNEYT